MESLEIHTHEREQFVEITDQIKAVLQRQEIPEGMCVVYCPHTTAAVTVNENADPDVVHDMLAWLHRAIPQRQSDFRHSEGNSDAHIKSSLVGPSVTLLVENRDLVLGRWQGVYFCEFDGPRTRQVHVQVVGN